METILLETTKSILQKIKTSQPNQKTTWSWGWELNPPQMEKSPAKPSFFD
jgi:hypothetical protein